VTILQHGTGAIEMKRDTIRGVREPTSRPSCRTALITSTLLAA